MFIAGDRLIPSAPSGGAELDLRSTNDASLRPSERRKDFHSVAVYKYVTPNGVRSEDQLINALRSSGGVGGTAAIGIMTSQ